MLDTDGSKKGSALVTGGAKRIGSSIALRLGELGYNVALHYNKSHEEAESIASLVRKNGVICNIYSCELSDIDAIDLLLPKVLRDFPDLCMLVNNASVYIKGGLLDGDERVFEDNFNINFRAPFFLSAGFGKLCGGGLIINLLDTRVASHSGRHFIYTLSKKALESFTRMAARELAPNIRVNAIAPGAILPPKGKNEEYLEGFIEKTPLKRIGDVKFVLQAVEFLVKNEFVTGEIIYVDGGRHLL